MEPVNQCSEPRRNADLFGFAFDGPSHKQDIDHPVVELQEIRRLRQRNWIFPSLSALRTSSSVAERSSTASLSVSMPDVLCRGGSVWDHGFRIAVPPSLIQYQTEVQERPSAMPGRSSKA